MAEKILFITATRIGDAILSTGILDYMTRTWPEARITVACGPLVEGFFTPVPQVERVIALKKEKYGRHWLTLWREVWPTQWDMVVDLRNSAVSRLIRANRRYIFGRHIAQGIAKPEQNAAVMKLDHVPPLRLWFDDETLAAAAEAVPEGGPVLAIGPAANWRAKTWPADRFIELVRRLTNSSELDAILPNARVAVVAAPGEEAQSRPVLESIPDYRRIDLIAKGSPQFAAACLARCSLYVGNNSGLMHSAAAAGIPTFGLFGPSWPQLYRPFGPKTDYIATKQDFAQLIAYDGYDPKTAPCLMTSLSVDDVTDRVIDFWQALHNQKAA